MYLKFLLEFVPAQFQFQQRHLQASERYANQSGILENIKETIFNWFGKEAMYYSGFLGKFKMAESVIGAINMLGFAESDTNRSAVLESIEEPIFSWFSKEIMFL